MTKWLDCEIRRSITARMLVIYDDCFWPIGELLLTLEDYFIAGVVFLCFEINNILTDIKYYKYLSHKQQENTICLP